MNKVQPNHTNYSQTDINQIDYIYCGSFENVKLNKNDYMMLISKLDNKLNDYIERLSLYLSSIGRTYKDHVATILAWYQKDKAEEKLSPGRRIFTLDDYQDIEI